LIKRHINEAGSQWFRELTVQQSAALFTAQISLVEICSALNRRLREQFINTDEYQRLIAQSRFLFASTYSVMEFSDRISDLACAMLERHALRAIDAIHLATGIVTHEQLRNREEPTLTFLSADHRLLTAATAEGLSTFDPSTVS
jgi:hypothetical protein